MTTDVVTDVARQGMEFILPFGLCGLLFIGIAIPIILEKVPPNPWYGFRTPKTFSDKAIWYKANKYAGRHLFGLGCILVVYNLVLFLFQPAFICHEPIANLVLLTGGMAVVLVRSFKYLGKL